MATSLAAFMQCVILYVILKRKIGDFGIVLTIKNMKQCLLSGGVMCLVIKTIDFFFVKIKVSGFYSLILYVICGSVVYMSCSILMKNYILMKFMSEIKTVVKKLKNNYKHHRRRIRCHYSQTKH